MVKVKRTKPYLLIGLILLFAGLAAAAASGSVSGIERDIFLKVYEMPESLRGIALFVTQFGSIWVLLGIVGILFVVKWNPRAAIDIFRGGVLVYVLVLITKVIVARPRPSILLENITTREVFTYGQGFPSGHTALATVVSLILLKYLPKNWRWLPVAWVGLVAWSRIYLGVHVPLDILGGIILGLIVVLGVDYLPKLKR